ncbi:hypothetical protein [Hydrogenophaga sp.]|uniref:hypothetical protein n=1 Tax=Hydrogenophaga sp. TaxID=1904254 RepID=UPI002630E797|nr:hypothetical protein [Hydrogenophaga sp.]MCW5654850.1 hypothetical protein [Hydrogenophaga sp.]
MSKTLLMIGVGDLAGLVLNLLVQGKEFGKIILAGRDLAEMNRRKNLALLFSAQLGRYHRIECVQMDLQNVEQSAHWIRDLKPDVIFNTATLQSWRIITQLPTAAFKALDEAQFGPWLPMHLSLMHKLMKAVDLSGQKPFVVNAAFPDAVGPVLKSVGMAPQIGIGNVANVLPALRGALGLMLEVPLQEVHVSLYTQHYLSHRVPAAGDSGGAPYVARARINGHDVTGEVDFEDAFGLVQTKFQRTGGAFRQLITASSAVSVLSPVLLEQTATVHAPAPGGLPGGYRVRLVGGEAVVDVPDGMALDTLIQVNNDCQRFDGIDRIEADGTVVFTEREMQVMHRLLGYECLRMPLSEVDARAEELGAKYREFFAKATA